MIDTVIFDIGNVLIDFDWEGYVNSLMDGETAKRVSEAIFMSGYWSEYDKGLIPEEKIVDLMVSSAPDLEGEIRRALDINRIGGCLKRMDYSGDWIRELKDKGYRVLYLSNYSDYSRRANPDVLYFLPLMDGGVFSYEVHELKPDPAIYQCIADKYSLNPRHCLFIDDLEANVEGAVHFGMHSIQFMGFEESKSGIDRYLEENGIPSKRKEVVGTDA